jgi:hypothetical protein
MALVAAMAVLWPWVQHYALGPTITIYLDNMSEVSGNVVDLSDEQNGNSSVHHRAAWWLKTRGDHHGTMLLLQQDETFRLHAHIL